MSTKAENSEKSQNQPEIQTQQNPNPEAAAKNEADKSGQSEEQRIANAVSAVHQANPDLTPDEIASIVAQVMKKTETIPAKVDKEASRIIGQADTTYKDKIYLKKDKKRQFPLEREALNGVIVRQTYKRQTEEGDEVTVPARNLNELAIYSEDEFDRLNHGNSKLPGFAREGVLVDVWHKPGQTDTVQED